MLVCVKACFDIPIALNYKYILLGGLCYDAIKLIVEMCDLLVLMVRSLHACGKVQELTCELRRYRWDILGLAEVRWTGFGEDLKQQSLCEKKL